MKKMSLIGAIILSLVLVASTFAQFADPEYTTYNVVNMTDEEANVAVTYYDSNGVAQTAANKSFTLPASGSKLVVQYTDDPNLPTGAYSAVISADKEIAAIVNQEFAVSGQSSYSPHAPFSTYSGQSQGATEITLPAVMYNWYGYYTDIYIMNVGSAAATNVDITYVPGQMDVGSGPEATGASGVTDNDNTVARYASLNVSQESLTSLGAPSGTFSGRFLGSAVITSDQPIIAVVNQVNVGATKLMTYNGFTGGSTKVAGPSYMRGYYGYYTTVLVANPDLSATANVTVTYNPDTSETYYNEVEPGSTIAPVTVNHTIAPQKALTRYDGYDATDGQSDLDDAPNAYIKFFGSIVVESDIPVMVQVNVEAQSTGDGQAGSYNGIPTSEGSQNLVVPVILADFYGYYTALIVQNTTGTPGTCDVTYTSDGDYSAVQNHNETYSHSLAADGSFTVYEGRKGNVEDGDINSDPATWESGGNKQFIGSATISCSVPVVAFVNEEADVAQQDSMYTFNTFATTP